ncbi:MAG: transglutaminase domain-containing protein, partial [bacterium]|nr:transglutaminase domain-containing protein [bacterium]
MIQPTARFRNLGIALIACVAIVCLFISSLRAARLYKSTVRLRAEVADLKVSAKQMEQLRSDILMLEMARVVDALTIDAESTQEQAFRIGEWIAGHISNRETQGKDDQLTAFAERKGFCGTRSSMFVRMLSIANITGRRFNLYNFGRVGGDHACAQVFYDDRWHFFDVTYGGVFIRDGNILSWREITQDPESAVANMHVFEKTRDRTYSKAVMTGQQLDRREMSNRRRMEKT